MKTFTNYDGMRSIQFLAFPEHNIIIKAKSHLIRDKKTKKQYLQTGFFLIDQNKLKEYEQTLKELNIPYRIHKAPELDTIFFELKLKKIILNAYEIPFTKTMPFLTYPQGIYKEPFQP